MNIFVTGGAGFIGSAFLNLMVPRHPEAHFFNIDALSYAANLQNCEAIAHAPNYTFLHADITDFPALSALFGEHRPDWVIHFAAESHVDRSIDGPTEFVQVNIVGTFNLLECCRLAWGTGDGHVYHQVSTDEVYGSLGDTGQFTETTAYDPHSPYSASKAAADHLVRAYYHTYRLPIKITTCSNNYGPRQFPEKMIPLMILNALEGKPLPVYGDGGNQREWIYVDDHCEGIWAVAARGRVGETYNIGSGAECRNIDVVRRICRYIAQHTGRSPATLERLITFVADRPGHDYRYALDATKIRRELGWAPQQDFESGLANTVRWYLEHPQWIADIRTGAYRYGLATAEELLAGASV